MDDGDKQVSWLAAEVLASPSRRPMREISWDASGLL